MSKNNISKNKGIFIVNVLAVATIMAFPFFGGALNLSIMVMAGLNAVVVIGLSLLMGYAGQISLGQAAFFGLGAYVSGILSATYHWSPLVTIPLAVLVTGVVALLVGAFILRLHEHYLALATLGLGLILQVIFNEESQLTGGPSGLTGIPSLQIGPLSLDTDFKFYYLVWVIVLVLLVFTGNIIRSRVGRALRAIHGSEIAARSLGVNTTFYKIQVFAFSACLAALAGALFAHYVTVITPGSSGLTQSVELLIMAVVGGLGSIWGPVIGAVGITFLGQFLKDWIYLIHPNAGGEFEIIAFGIILVVVMIFMPKGLTHAFASLFDKILMRARLTGTATIQESLPVTGQDALSAPGKGAAHEHTGN